MSATATRRRKSPAAPPPRVPVPVDEHMHLLGERVVLRTRRGWRQHLRAVSNVHEDDDGRMVINVLDEGEWYLLARAGRFSDGTTHSMIETHPAGRVWVEVLQPEFSEATTLT
ncbi:hypothetical protein ACIHFD_49355 [Nonomuraea sp. NPDC051941]|uniref:hypothetical protein n=1 Tax=Nonomuraea sp. NPDC051941 TaxID=3364373 RepID=UPI0037C6E109